MWDQGLIYKVGDSSMTTILCPSTYRVNMNGISQDGKVAVGTMFHGSTTADYPDLSQAFVYDSAGVHPLGMFGETSCSYSPVDITADGATILCHGSIGQSGETSFLYTIATGQRQYLYITPDNGKVTALGMTPYGTVVFGYTPGGRHPLYWLKSENFSVCHEVPFPGSPNFESGKVFAASSNGFFLFGYYNDGTNGFAVRWNRFTGEMQKLGPVTTSDGTSTEVGPATSCSSDGNIAIGEYGNNLTFIWTPQTGAVDLDKFLADNGCPRPDGHMERTQICFDGTMISGVANRFNVGIMGYYIYLPTPVAVNDVFDVPETVGLQTTPATGVFFNDRNTQNATATVVDQPQHGTLVLNSGGSFKYTPNAGFSGTDMFSYKAANAQFSCLPAQVTLIIQPRYLSSLALSTPSSPGAKTVQGKATFGIPAAAGSLLLMSSKPSAASVPASVPVLQGATSATFPITTGWVLTDSKVTITATFKGLIKSVVVTVVAPKLTGFTLGPTTIVGGNNPVGKLTLNGQAADPGATVLMSSSNPAVASVISKTVIPTGATFARFFVYTKGVSAPGSATITASYHGVVLTQNVTVTPASLGSIVAKSSTIVGTRLGSFTVALDGFAPTGGASISLSSSSASLPVPANVTVPAGGKNAYFSARAAKVLADTVVTITGSYQGVTKSVSVTLHPG